LNDLILKHSKSRITKIVLSKENRLKNKKDFDNVFKKGRRVKGDFLFLKILENNLDASRFAFVVGLKISKKAVIRNKIKRRLRYIVREKFSDIRKGIDVMIITLPGIENQDFKTMKNSLNSAFVSAGIVDNKL
jgi:ribonuclease P protein component